MTMTRTRLLELGAEYAAEIVAWRPGAYGFARVAGATFNVFVGSRDVVDGLQLRVGDLVTFTLALSHDGRWRAANVELAANRVRVTDEVRSVATRG